MYNQNTVRNLHYPGVSRSLVGRRIMSGEKASILRAEPSSGEETDNPPAYYVTTGAKAEVS